MGARNVYRVETETESGWKNGPVFTRIKDIPGVEVLTRQGLLKKYPDLVAPDNVWFIHILKKNNNRDDKRLTFITFANPSPVGDYIISGSIDQIPYISLWINSTLGRWELSRSERQITKADLENLVIPKKASGTAIHNIGLLELTAHLAYALGHSGEKNVSDAILVASSLFSYVERYMAMELVVPQEFEKKGISIIESWNRLVARTPEIQSGQATPDDVIRFLTLIFSDNREMMDNINRMKYYYHILFPICTQVLSRY